MKYCLQQSNLEEQQGEKGLGELVHLDNDISCKECPQKFNKKSHLYRHVRQKHENKRIHRCLVEGCKKEFKRGSHLKRHMISHTHVKAFKCEKCIMSFGYKHHLDRHIKLIHMKVLFKCSECPEEFLKKKSLNKHSKEHQKKKEKELKRLQKMKKKNHEDKTHQTVHENEEMEKRQEIYESEIEEEKMVYRCTKQDCISAFLQQNSLKKHLKSVHQIEC